MTNIEKIASLYKVVVGTTPTADELNDYAKLEDITLEVMSTSMMNLGNIPSNSYKTMYDSGESLLLLKTLYQSIFNLTEDEVNTLAQNDPDGFQYWIDALSDTSDDITIDTLPIALINAADQSAQASMSAEVADAIAAYEAKYGQGSGGAGVEGDTFVLKETRDNMEGTANNDTFKAYVGANQSGAIANALSTGDMIDGKGGSEDTLQATLVNDEYVDSSADNFAVMPVVDNVENIRIQAIENSLSNEDVVLDTDHITGENHYASDSSRADLIITNVDITSTQITKDITLEMKDTQQLSDMEVYFNESDLKKAPDEVTGSAQVVIQVADGAQTDASNPIGNMTFDLTFSQGSNSYSFDDISSTDGTYEGLKSAIELVLLEKGLTKYTVAVGEEFSSFTTESGKTVDLDYTANYITITDDEGEQFTDINFAPKQKAGSPVAILLAQSEVNAQDTTVTYMVESDVIFDNVGRGSNGGEFIVGSTSSSDSSTGVERINVTVENNSVVSDISSTNDALKHITLTNGTVKGNFVLANADFAGAENFYGNVDQASLLKEGLDSIIATNFDGDITLGRDNNIVNLGTLSANVNGDVTYKATMNDEETHTVVTGAGSDTLNITLDDDLAESNGANEETIVNISTGGAADTITVNEDDTALEDTEATIDSGAGDDVINGNDVTVHVTAGQGNDTVYVDNTGDKALLSFGTAALYTTATAATQGGAHANGTIHFLAGREVTVTLATNGNAAGLLTNGYESATVEITASSGALTTLADLNAAVVKAINEDAKLSKLAVASIDENNNVAIQYLVDGAQNAGAAELTIADPAAATSISSQMLTEYRDLTNNSTLTSAAVLALYNAALTTTTASTTATEGSTLLITTTAAANDTTTITIGDDVTVVTHTLGTLVGTAAEITAALKAKGYVVGDTVANTVAVVTDQEVKVEYSGSAAGTLTNNAAITVADIAGIVGTDSDVSNPALTVNADKNTVNGGSGDDVIVLSSDATAGLGDTVAWTGYNQGNDTIAHFETTIDKLDFTSYLTGTIEANNSGSTSSESEIDLANTAVGTDAFTANSINLIAFTADLDAITTETFDTLTAKQVESLLEADGSATTTLTDTATGQGSLYQNNGVSVLVIRDDTAITGNDGKYKAFEVTYADATVGAGVAKDFTVKLIGSFDLSDSAAPSTLALGDFVL